MVMPNTYWAISTRRRSNKAESIQAPSKKDWKEKVWIELIQQFKNKNLTYLLINKKSTLVVLPIQTIFSTAYIQI